MKSLRIELITDAIPGSGEGLAGVIDTDISYDEFGLPFIPAKRIKGILRESSRDLEDAGALSQQGLTQKIFGEKGKRVGTDFKISDGRLDNYTEIRKFLQYASSNKKVSHIFNREAVLGFYTYTRSQTTIDKDGVAKEDTLRTFRILRKGLTFKFDIEYPLEYEADITKICKVSRRFGISRTRGTGEFALSIDPYENAEPKLSDYS